MNILFWVALALLAYPLFIYPLMLAFTRLTGRGKERRYAPLSPTVSILLSVYNEKDVIERKVENFLALDYPPENLELLVVSDGSDDGTDDLARRSGSERVRLLRQEARSGKTSALNRAAKEARGEVLFFTDADSMLKPDCIRHITAPFADLDVGLVSGRSIYLDTEGRETAGSLYRRYEEWIKEREGECYGIAGADGAVYAMRRDLYRELPPEYINDLLHPVQVVLEGKKALCRPNALVTEPGESGGSGNELSRQTRIMAQSWLIFLRHASVLLAAKRYGFLWQFISHKVLRWLSVPLMVLLFAVAVCLPGVFPSLVLAGLAVLVVLAFLGRSNGGGLLGRVAWLFMLQSVAGSYGLYKLLRGERFVTWKPRGK